MLGPNAAPRRLAALWLVLLVLLVLPALRAAAAPVELPAPARYAVFLLGQRAGQAKITASHAKFEGKPAIRLDADVSLKVSALGELEQKILTRQYVTPKGEPVYLRTEIGALGRKTTVLARFFSNRVECDIDAGGQKSKKTVPIPKGIKLLGDSDVASMTGKAPKIGEKETYHYFEPASLSIRKMSTEVLREEKLRISDRTFDTFVIRSVDEGTGESTQWVTAKGELLQSEAKIGMKLVRDDFGPLAQQAYTPPPDLLAATSVRTTRKIEQPRTAKSLKVRMEGIPEASFILSDARQKATTTDVKEAEPVVVFEITASEPPATGAKLLAAGSDALFAGDAPYLGTTDPEIRRAAREIVGQETDRAVVARKIRDWVKQRISKPGNAGVLRSAKEIMANRDGVCREFATLFAALARAAGIPTRVCGGVLYHENAFYYHAWVECQLADGDDGWYPFDATLPGDLVDATHIKFSQGDVTDMFQATRLVGRLKAEILDYK